MPVATENTATRAVSCATETLAGEERGLVRSITELPVLLERPGLRPAATGDP
jgi:hypothetical protein